jgi:hypothetical protein
MRAAKSSSLGAIQKQLMSYRSLRPQSDAGSCGSAAIDCRSSVILLKHAVAISGSAHVTWSYMCRTRWMLIKCPLFATGSFPSGAKGRGG